MRETITRKDKKVIGLMKDELVTVMVQHTMM